MSGGVGERGYPAYPLDEVQAAFGAFHKSQAHRTEPGVWLDIYKPFLGSQRLYVKFLKLEEGDAFRVLSFCGDGEPH